jgi:hypothetical protein
MKKILGLTMLTMLMLCCEVGPRQASAGQRVATHDNNLGTGDVVIDIVNKNNMEFHIYHNYHGVFVVNQTKELLEVELLKKQINEIDKRNQE